MAFAHPRSQTLIVSLVCIIAVASAFVLSRDNTSSTGKSTNSNDISIVDSSSVTASATSTFVDTASSSDNWKNSFVTGDVAVNGSQQKPPTSLTDDADQTMTALFGKEALVSFMALRQSGMTADANAVDAASQSVISSTVNAKSAEVYVLADLNTVPASDTNSLNTFSAEVARIFSLYRATRNEAVITSQSFSLGDPEILKEIDRIIDDYDQIIASLKNIRTPSVVALDMVDLINGFSTMKFNAESLRASKVDPLRGMLGVQDYQNGIKMIVNAILAMRATLESRNVSFVFDGNFINVMLGNS